MSQKRFTNAKIVLLGGSGVGKTGKQIVRLARLIGKSIN